MQLLIYTELEVSSACISGINVFVDISGLVWELEKFTFSPRYHSSLNVNLEPKNLT